ncbi:DUF397 domain-containing protein [Wenjunlia tyrosinilytica]|uniref:Toxin n=1 Tax=Wenjunlia tyrosinilytica TaxID=1544741 RepID=A0A918DW56_9ACTN|nr:DUF397 domain-containing protein [Wenjunlia tyrosinilytica]GGO85029.1 toxin [Wenjunlia tyrosinilytica]
MGTVHNLTAAQWRKSSYSGPNGGECIEVAALSGAQWRKSSHSGPDGGDCVEVAAVQGVVAVRDSKDPDGPALAFSPEAFAAFVTAAASGALRA